MKIRVELIRACKEVLKILYTFPDSPYSKLGWKVLEIRHILNEALKKEEENE